MPTTARAAAGMGVITAISRAFGFARVLVVAAVLGTTYLGNTFQAANSVSNLLFELLAAGALSAVLVPTFVDLLDRADGSAEEVAGAVLGLALLVLGAVSLFGVLVAPALADALIAGAPPAAREAQHDLTTYLLRWFIPQVLLYAAGTVAVAVLYAKRRLLATAAAPIGNTVVMIACLVAFRAAAGADAGVGLSDGERLLLAAAGTGGVVAFVAVLLVACRASGFRLWPRWPGRDPRVTDVLRRSAWGVVLHTGAGMLLAAALVVGGGVEGGVVAYQVAFVFFLAPYAIFAQPVHTAILPDLVREARDDDTSTFATSVRWAIERIALFTIPIAVLMMALALPLFRVVAFGETGDAGAELLAAALASLAAGLLPYSIFLLLARAFYALGDSRGPGLVSVACAAGGVVVIGVGSTLTEGAAQVALLGVGHSVAYAVGSLVLARQLARRTGERVWPASIVRVLVIAGAVAGATWAIVRAVSPDDAGRGADVATLAVGAAAALGAMLIAGRAAGLQRELTARLPSTAGEVAS